jgi:hypothetical protein
MSVKEVAAIDVDVGMIDFERDNQRPSTIA